MKYKSYTLRFVLNRNVGDRLGGERIKKVGRMGR